MKIGRFAPSPTGPLHMGSLITALASFLDIKAKRGLWLIRIDDLDQPRIVPGSIQAILESLQAHGLVSDRKVIYQSRNSRKYKTLLEKLAPNLYPCQCSRKILVRQRVYPGTCLKKDILAKDVALRIKVSDACISFRDNIQGTKISNLQQETGDFIVMRRDKLFSYNLATACDDGDQEITDVLRGEDLFLTTSLQIFLMNKLNLEVPEYSHIPVLYNLNGQKLSKQTGAPPISDFEALKNLVNAMKFLGLDAPSHIKTIPSLIGWGVRNWSIKKIPKKPQFYG